MNSSPNAPGWNPFALGRMAVSWNGPNPIKNPSRIIVMFLTFGVYIPPTKFLRHDT